ncbi:MAG TPA: hypothetical protein VIV60_14080 [Polyangiaceae bacterium]
MTHEPKRRTLHLVNPRVLALVMSLFVSACRSGSDASSEASVAGKVCSAEVTNPSARACDILFGCDGYCVARFASTVRGTAQQLGAMLAVAFTARQDQPLSGPMVTIGVTNGTGCAHAKLTSCTCYDRSGRAIDSGALNFHEAE